MEFNPEQKAAIESNKKNILVLAGAGSGKTRVITARTLRLIEDGVPPERILLLTFTRRAASEMRERLFSVSPQARKVNASTFHLFCLRMLRSFPELFGIHELTVIDRDDQVRLMKMAREEIAEKSDAGFPKPTELINYFSYARNSRISISDYLHRFAGNIQEDILEKIEQTIEIYGNYKSLNRYLDFDDILIRFADQTGKNELTAKRMRDRFDHILVDEMQDTNPIQWEILDHLRNPAKLFCVGDDAQSIYAFRGADFNNVHRFKERVEDSEVLKLTYNYRSKQKILNLANELLNHSPLSYDKELQGTSGEGKRPRLFDFLTKDEEADQITNDILEKVNAGVSFNDMMVLTRSAWSARVFEAACIAKEIPYRFIGGLSLFEGAHIKDLLSLCRILANRKDQLAWLRFLTLFPRIGPRSAAKFFLKNNEDFVSEELLWQETGKFLKRPEIATDLSRLDSLKQSPVDFMIRAVEMITPVIDGKYDRQESRQKDLQLIIELSKKHRTISGFLETYALDPITAVEAANERPEEQLTLITVHSAKGTEAEICYMIQSGYGNYPHSRSLGSENEIEEERRIMYVAITRAKNELILSHSRDTISFSNYSPYQTQDELKTRCFLMQIPSEELFEFTEQYY